MNILVMDSKGVLSRAQVNYARNRLYYSLARFGHRINGATIHFSMHGSRQSVKCAINVSVEGSGVVSVKRSSLSAMEVVNLAVDALEPKIAFRVDWRSWFNSETLATYMFSLNQRLQRRLGLNVNKPIRNQLLLQQAPVDRGFYQSD